MKLCVALDLPTLEENLKLVNELKDFKDIWFKIGLRTYLEYGIKAIEGIKNIDSNLKIFLDLKLYDIPNTMANSAEVLAKLDVDMFNIHASAGEVALKTVMNRLAKLDKRPLVLAVTALTSFDEYNFQKVYNSSIDKKALEFAKMSYENEVDGVVCSVYESKMIKENTNKKFITLTPGIRPFGESSDDQKRVATLEMAKENLSDFIVIGRPIYQADNPYDIVSKILKVTNV